jgi:hypothetical protein
MERVPVLRSRIIYEKGHRGREPMARWLWFYTLPDGSEVPAVWDALANAWRLPTNQECPHAYSR